MRNSMNRKVSSRKTATNKNASMKNTMNANGTWKGTEQAHHCEELHEQEGITGMPT